MLCCIVPTLSRRSGKRSDGRGAFERPNFTHRQISTHHLDDGIVSCFRYLHISLDDCTIAINSISKYIEHISSVYAGSEMNHDQI